MVEQPREIPNQSSDATADLISPFKYSTTNFAKTDQCNGWYGSNTSTVDLTQMEERGDGAETEPQIWDLGSFILTRRESSGASFARTWRHLKKDPFDYWSLVIVEDAASVDQTGAVSPRLISFASRARSFEGGGVDANILSLFARRDLFTDVTHLFDATDNAIADAGLGAVLADYLLCLQRWLPRLSQGERSRVAEATSAMITLCLAPTIDHKSAMRNSAATTLLERAREIIQSNLGLPTLGAEFLCRTLGVSRSRLYRLFDLTGGVMHAIQRQRLLKAHEILSNPNSDRPIVQLAEELGFSDPSGFSRSFKKEFGYCPTEARRAGLFGLSQPPRINSLLITQAAQLSNIGRRLDC